MAATLPTGLTGPVQVALARPVEQIPRMGALPGGCRFEPKWDGFFTELVKLVLVFDGSRR
jgi:hypothetical protein